MTESPFDSVTTAHRARHKTMTTTNKTATNVWDMPDDDEPEISLLFTEPKTAIDYSDLLAAQKEIAELGIVPVHPLASPFERKHRERQAQASGFNADLGTVLDPLLEDSDAQALASTAARKLGLNKTVVAKEVKGFTDVPVSSGQHLLAVIVQKTMKDVQPSGILWAMPGLGSLKGADLEEGKVAIEPLLSHLVETRILDKAPAMRGRSATYALTDRLKLAKTAADTLPVSGLILFLDKEGKVFQRPTHAEIKAGQAIPEVVISEEDGFVTCTNTGTTLPCGKSRILSVPFVTPDEETIERLYQIYKEERAELLEEAADDEERLKALQEELEPSYWDTLRTYPSHAATTLVAKDDRGRLLIQSDVGQHMTKDLRQHLTFLEGSKMFSADGKAFVASLTAAILGNCTKPVAELLNLSPRKDGLAMEVLLQQASDRDNLRSFLKGCVTWEEAGITDYAADEEYSLEGAVNKLLAASAGHRDPYAAVWLSCTKTLRNKIKATGHLPRELVKKAFTPLGYGSGKDNVALILKRDYGLDRELGLELATAIAAFPPLQDALRVMRKAKTPCASFTGTVRFDFAWQDENFETHSFHCETSTVIDNHYVGREWRINDVLVLRTGEENLTKARTALLANLNQGIEAWLLECQSAFATHLGVELWSTHDQTSTHSEYTTRLITGITATALNAILEQNLSKMAKAWGLKLPKRTHAPYDVNTPFYVFEAEE